MVKIWHINILYIKFEVALGGFVGGETTTKIKLQTQCVGFLNCFTHIQGHSIFMC
jgi:hypothetical protein